MRNKGILLLCLSIMLFLLASCDSGPGNTLDELLDTQAKMIIKRGNIDCSLEGSEMIVTIDYTIENTGDVDLDEIVVKNPEYKETVVEYIDVTFNDGDEINISDVKGQNISEKIVLPNPIKSGETFDIRLKYGVSGFDMPDGDKKTWRWVVPYLDATALTEEFRGMPIKISFDQKLELVSSVPLGFEKEDGGYKNTLNGLINMIILEVTN